MNDNERAVLTQLNDFLADAVRNGAGLPREQRRWMLCLVHRDRRLLDVAWNALDAVDDPTSALAPQIGALRRATARALLGEVAMAAACWEDILSRPAEGRSDRVA